MVEAEADRVEQSHGYFWHDIASQGSLILDEEGIIRSANPAIEAMLGYEAGGLIGNPYSALEIEALSLPEKLISDKLSNSETVLRHQNGRSIPVTVSITSLPADTIGTKLVSIMDLTDVERLNQALSHTQRLASVGTLTASIAHELTNPLSIITATCSNLLHELNKENINTEQLLYYIQMIEQSAWRSARIVEVLRHYAHHSAPQRAVTHFSMIIEDALTLVRQQLLKEFNVTVETELAPDLKSIVCDHNRITQVLINLLTNACHAMQPEGGAVFIKAWSIQPAEAATQADPDALAENNREGKLAFSVRDCGHGIAPELMEKIFMPFFTTKPGGEGMGLGLFIARGIVEQHNGRIWAENNPDGGATFTVILPQKS